MPADSSLVTLQAVDWAIVAAVLVGSLAIGAAFARRAGQSTADYFLSGRDMPWWILGVSMVATTFAADTPNLVTQIVRESGVSGNWVWWALVLSSMVTAFVFARLWRRSAVLTDNEFYELRYSGRPATALRGFRALYLGLVFNTIVMANVNLAAAKFGAVLLGLPPWQTLALGCGVTVVYSSLGGLRGILVTDFVQFAIAMAGSVAACLYVLDLPEVGGLSSLLAHENVAGKLSLIPDFSNPDAALALFVIPLVVVWWSAYYPGAEPGGGGYIAQRMLAARSERHAMGAAVFYNLAHYALRPWPWILIALASLAVFPTTADLASALPEDQRNLATDDIAYPLMLTRLPPGLLGVVVASLVAAYMSTISTQLNVGSSYLTHDFYRRFVNPEASERRLVWTGRAITVGLVVLAALVSFVLESAGNAFRLMILVGAGSGLIYMLRWLWWRVNAAAEIAAMVVSFATASFFVLVYPKLIEEGTGLAGHWQTVITVGVTSLAWLAATVLGPATERGRLAEFARKVRPPGPGWKPFAAEIGPRRPEDGTPLGLSLTAAALGVVAVLGTLLGTGYWIYGQTAPAAACTAAAAASAAVLVGLRRQL